MRHIALAVFFVLAPLVSATDSGAQDWPENADRVVVTAFFDDSRLLEEFAAEKAPWKVDRRKGYLIVDANRLEFEQMQKAGFRLEIDTARTADLNAVRVVDPAQRAGIPGYSCYRTVDETLATGAQLAVDYPDLATWTDVGDSWEKVAGFGGDDMMVLKLTNSAIGGDKPKLFMTSAIHAREYTTAELNTRFAEYLLSGYGVDADVTWLLDFHEIHLMLHTNPDGRRRAQTGLSWRKNTNQNFCSPTSENRGVDLNRNFAFGWGCCGGSSGNECSLTYRGPGAGSEFETDAVQSYMQSIFPDSRGPNVTDAAPADTPGLYIDIHSFSELVLWPWGNTNNVAPNGNQMRTLGRRFAWFNDYSPEQSISLYPTDGTTGDFAYGELGVAAYTFELGTAFFQNCGTFENTILPDNLPALVYAAKSARAPYQAPAGPDTLDVETGSGAIAPGESLAVSARIDDTRFSNANGTEPVQAIVAAQVTIDTPPWDPAAVPVALAATDGSFNTSAEDVSGVVSSAGLGTGRHTVFVRGQDSSGAWGNPSAAFVFVIDPLTAPRIRGRVVAADTGAPLAATVTAASFSTTTDANGDYELLLVAGAFDLSIVPDDTAYGAQTLADVVAIDDDITTLNVQLFPFCELLSDDMETGSLAWATQGSWARTNEASNSPSFAYSDSPGGNYGNNVDASLTSPPIDLSSIGSIELDFASRCDTESGYDYCIVEVSADGASWSELARYDGNSASFVNRSFVIDALAGAPGARVRFRLSTDVSVREDGWYVDDVVVRGAGAQCVAASDSDGDGVADPVDNCTLVANAAQIDTNGDGYGNACDADLDNDGVVNASDLGLLRSAFFQAGALDSDFNGDGITNATDLGIMRSLFFAPPGPSGQAGP